MTQFEFAHFVDGSVISSNGDEVIAELRELGDGSYYWVLPAEFTGNQLGAYGG